MKKVWTISSVLCLFLLVFVGCAADKKETQTDTQATTTPTTTAPTVDDGNGIGGDGDWNFIRKMLVDFTIEDRVYRLVDEDEYTVWESQFKEIHPDGTRDRDEYNVYTLITEFEIPREEIESICDRYEEMNDGEKYFTDEQVEAIYNGTMEDVVRAFANPYAVIVGTKVYSPEWMTEHTAAEYAAEGITYEILTAEFEDLLVPCNEEQRAYLRTQYEAMKP